MHFTYDEQLDATQLYQGDLIVRNDAVDAILQDVHPHYRKADYRAFIVLTQTCDLVRRNGSCGARYISIAAVRPLSLVLTRALEHYCRNKWEAEHRVTSMKTKEKLRLFVERLLNNNEDEYFFLYREPEAGLSKDSCAFLQLSIAIKSELHYDTLLAAKKLQLADTFQHKLGYLVGKMYSRIGTPDWVPTLYPDERQFSRHINALIAGSDFAIWIDDDAYRALEKRVEANGEGSVTQELLLTWAQEIQSAKAKKRQAVIDAIKASMTDVGVGDGVCRRAAARIEANAVFQSLFK